MKERRTLAPSAADLDLVTLRTIGVDIGSATTHLMFAEVVMARESQRLSSRYHLVEHHPIWQSPVIMTPYADEGDSIDSAALEEFLHRCVSDAGIDPAQLDSGAVLLTGTALLRHNARAIAERVSNVAGGFVCAAAGHHLEAVLAAHGSGAVSISREVPTPVLNLDMGGGTTKLAVAQGGSVRSTAALAVGSRLIAWDGARRLVRLEGAASTIAGVLGIRLRLGDEVSEDVAERLADLMADVVVQTVLGTGRGGAFARSLDLTAPASMPPGPWKLVLSGGVAECAARPQADPGDLGPLLGRAILARLDRAGLAERLLPARERIRATVVGASQFSTQVSGMTLHLPDPGVLPVHNVPVIVLNDLEEEADIDERAVAAQLNRGLDSRAAGLPCLETAAVSIRWQGPPTWERLRAVAAGIAAAASGRPGLGLVVVVVDADLSASLGRVLVDDVGWHHPSLVCLDGLDLSDLDYLDIGLPSRNGGACPVVVKSLLFGVPETGEALKVPAGRSLSTSRGGSST